MLAYLDLRDIATGPTFCALSASYPQNLVVEITGLGLLYRPAFADSLTPYYQVPGTIRFVPFRQRPTRVFFFGRDNRLGLEVMIEPQAIDRFNYRVALLGPRGNQLCCMFAAETPHTDVELYAGEIPTPLPGVPV